MRKCQVCVSVRKVLIILSTVHQITPPHTFNNRICKTLSPKAPCSNLVKSGYLNCVCVMTCVLCVECEL